MQIQQMASDQIIICFSVCLILLTLWTSILYTLLALTCKTWQVIAKHAKTEDV